MSGARPGKPENPTSTVCSSACPNPWGSGRGLSPAAIVSGAQLTETDKDGLVNSKEIEESE